MARRCCGCGGSFPPECCSGGPYHLQYPNDEDAAKPKEDFITNLTIDAGSFWGEFEQDERCDRRLGCAFGVNGNLTGG